MSIDGRDESVQFWGATTPSQRDTLIVLVRALGLLREALPVALRHIGTQPLNEQSDFWHSFHCLDEISYFTELADDGYPEAGTPWEMKISGAMEEPREMVCAKAQDGRVGDNSAKRQADGGFAE